MVLPTQYFFSFSFCFLLQFLILSFIVNSLTNTYREKEEGRMLSMCLHCIYSREKEKSRKLLILCRSLPFFFFRFFSLPLNFKPASRFLIDLTKIDLHGNWLRSVQQHLHVVEKKKKLFDTFLLYSCNLIYHNKTLMMPTIETEQNTNIDLYTSHFSLSY